MQAGRRTAEWDKTAALITHLRLVNGDKEAKFEAYHPDTARQYQRSKLREYAKKERDKQDRSG